MVLEITCLHSKKQGTVHGTLVVWLCRPISHLLQAHDGLLEISHLVLQLLVRKRLFIAAHLAPKPDPRNELIPFAYFRLIRHNETLSHNFTSSHKQDVHASIMMLHHSTHVSFSSSSSSFSSISSRCLSLFLSSRPPRSCRRSVRIGL